MFPEERVNEALSKDSATISEYEDPCTDRDFSMPDRQDFRLMVGMWLFRSTRDLYSSPDHICRIARQFLDRYTMKRDNAEF